MTLVDDAVGNFGKWLLANILASGYDMTNFCKQYNLSRITVNRHIYHKVKPRMEQVREYCKIFGAMDIIWNVYDTMLDDWEKC